MRIANDKSYRCYADPPFKADRMLMKVCDIFHLRVGLLMHDFINKNFPVLIIMFSHEMNQITMSQPVNKFTKAWNSFLIQNA